MVLYPCRQARMPPVRIAVRIDRRATRGDLAKQSRLVHLTGNTPDSYKMAKKQKAYQNSSIFLGGCLRESSGAPRELWHKCVACALVSVIGRCPTQVTTGRGR